MNCAKQWVDRSSQSILDMTCFFVHGVAFSGWQWLHLR